MFFHIVYKIVKFRDILLLLWAKYTNQRKKNLVELAIDNLFSSNQWSDIILQDPNENKRDKHWCSQAINEKGLSELLRVLRKNLCSLTSITQS